MHKIIDGKWKVCCDNCKKVLGDYSHTRGDGELERGAGYVLGVGKSSGIHLHSHLGHIIIHPVACSDACEDRLLETWPRTNVGDVKASDWGEDFRDADMPKKKKQ